MCLTELVAAIENAIGATTVEQRENTLKALADVIDSDSFARLCSLESPLTAAGDSSEESFSLPSTNAEVTVKSLCNKFCGYVLETIKKHVQQKRKSLSAAAVSRRNLECCSLIGVTEKLLKKTATGNCGIFPSSVLKCFMKLLELVKENVVLFERCTTAIISLLQCNVFSEVSPSELQSALAFFLNTFHIPPNKCNALKVVRLLTEFLFCIGVVDVEALFRLILETPLAPGEDGFVEALKLIILLAKETKSFNFFALTEVTEQLIGELCNDYSTKLRALHTTAFEFVRLTLAIHNNDATSLSSVKSSRWSSTFRTLFTRIHSELNELTKSRFVDSTITPFIGLAADVYHHAFTSPPGTIDCCSIINSTQDELTRAKRQRIELSIHVFVEEILKERPIEQATQTAPWLKVLYELFQNYPQHIQQLQAGDILCCLHVRLRDWYRNESIRALLFKVLASVLICIKDEEVKKALNEDGAILTKLWELTFRNVSSKHCGADAYAVIRSLLKCPLWTGRRDVPRLFKLESSEKPNVESLQTLLLLMQTFEFCKFRKEILSWLCGFDLREAEEMYSTISMDNSELCRTFLSRDWKDFFLCCQLIPYVGLCTTSVVTPQKLPQHKPFKNDHIQDLCGYFDSANSKFTLGSTESDSNFDGGHEQLFYLKVDKHSTEYQCLLSLVSAVARYAESMCKGANTDLEIVCKSVCFVNAFVMISLKCDVISAKDRSTMDSLLKKLWSSVSSVPNEKLVKQKYILEYLLCFEPKLIFGSDSKCLKWRFETIPFDFIQSLFLVAETNHSSELSQLLGRYFYSHKCLMGPESMHYQLLRKLWSNSPKKSFPLKFTKDLIMADCPEAVFHMPPGVCMDIVRFATAVPADDMKRAASVLAVWKRVLQSLTSKSDSTRPEVFDAFKCVFKYLTRFQGTNCLPIVVKLKLIEVIEVLLDFFGTKPDETRGLLQQLWDFVEKGEFQVRLNALHVVEKHQKLETYIEFNNRLLHLTKSAFEGARTEDASLNCHRLLVMGMTKAMVHCISVERSCLYNLLRSLRSQDGVVFSLYKHYLSQVARHRTLALKDYLQYHVKYIVSRWLMEEDTFDHFPFKLFETTTLTEFIANNVATVVYCAVTSGKHNLLELCRVGCSSFDDVVYAVLPSLLVWFYLPEALARSEKKASQMCLNFHMHVKAFISSAGMEKDFISKHLTSLVLESFLSLNRPFAVTLEDDHCAPEDHIDELLDFILQGYPNSKRLLFSEVLGCHRADSLVHILIQLRIRIFSASYSCDIHRFLHVYCKVAVKILDDIRNSPSTQRLCLIQEISWTLPKALKTGSVEGFIPPVFSILLQSLELLSTSHQCCEVTRDVLQRCLLSALHCMETADANLISHLEAFLKKVNEISTRSWSLSIRVIVPLPQKLCADLSEDFDLCAFLSSLAGCVETDFECFTTVGKALEEVLKSPNMYSAFVENEEVRKLMHTITLLLVKASQHGSEESVAQARKCLGCVPFSTVDGVVRNDHSVRTEVDASARHQLNGLYSLVEHLMGLIWSTNVTLLPEALECFRKFKTLCPEPEYRNLNGHDRTNLLNCLVQTRASPCKFSKHPSGVISRILEKLQSPQLWIVSPRYEDWIQTMVIQLLGIFEETVPYLKFLSCLLPLCKKQVATCEAVFPLVIEALLVLDENLAAPIAEILKSFIEHQNSAVDTMNDRDFRPLQAVLRTVSYMHGFRNSKINCWTRHFILPSVNYLELAKAAVSCCLPYQALFYCDIWFHHLKSTNTLNNSSGLSSGSNPLYRILLKAYQAVGNIDGAYGCFQLTDTLQPDYWITYVYEKNWNKILSVFQDEKQCSNEFYAKALLKSGLDGLTASYINSRTSTNMTVANSELYYEYCWRLGQWNADSVVTGSTAKDSYNLCVFEAAKNLYEDAAHSKFFTHLGQEGVFKRLRGTELSCSYSYLPTLQQLHALNVLEESMSITDGKCTASELTAKWNLRNNTTMLCCSDFDNVEPILWTQAVALQRYGEKFQDFDEYVNHVEKYIQYSLESGDISSAKTGLKSLELLKRADDDVRYRWTRLDAEVSWLQVDHEIAKKKLGSLIIDLKQSPSSSRLKLASALTLYAYWTSQTKSESSATIMRDYFEEALQAIGPHSKDRTAMKIYAMTAKFADEQYENVLQAYNAKVERLKKSHHNLDRVGVVQTQPEDKEYKRMTEKNLQLDKEDAEKTNKEKDNLLLKALENYHNCLKINDENDIFVFRLVSLWFRNHQSSEVMLQMRKVTEDLPSYKFLPLVYQLAVRIGPAKEKDLSLTSNVNRVLLRIAQEHPHHVLPVILALANADKDGSRRQSTGKTPRQEAAEKLLKKIKSSDQTSLMTLVKSYEVVWDAYMALAFTPVPNRHVKLPLPSTNFLSKITGQLQVPVITDAVKPEKTCSYTKVATIVEVSKTLTICNGASKPKLVQLTASDGGTRRQLVKADDVKKDAIMEQVFELANNLLQQNSVSRHHKLKANTYKVIPLSRKSGVVEWCAGTTPLKERLQNAHEKYHPEDWHQSECIKTLHGVGQLGPETKLRAYMRICKNFKPAMHHVFLENCRGPEDWYKKQVSFTKSVATTSILGYIFGLGDRHCSNILIDNETMEIIHIDFGVVFELGRNLPMPELVPFRLTRDIVDGMGACGVEGVFRRNCERVMQVMRSSQVSIMTILDVLLHDPLYAWQMLPKNVQTQQYQALTSTVKASNASRTENDSGTGDVVAAERTLHRVRQKLMGFEDNTQLSVRGQVNMVIQEAMDPMNLSKLYCGWEPYL